MDILCCVYVINKQVDKYGGCWCCVLKLQDGAECSGSLDAAAPLMINAMPDIAMASAAVARMSLSQSDDDDLEPTAALPPFPDLDLGDGANHSGGGGASCMHR